MANFHRDGGGPRKGGGKKFGERPGSSWQRSSPPGRDGGRPAMHRATCSECGNSCEVPFIPTGSRPIFCSNCFRKDQDAAPRFSNNSRPPQRPSFGEREMFQATCNKCGNSCEVPFRPTGEKPVFCKNCFAGGGGRGEQVPQPPHAHAPADQYKEQFKALNTKLDAILEALKKTNIAPTKAAEPQAKTEAAPPKKTEEKKVVAKKKKAVTKKK